MCTHTHTHPHPHTTWCQDLVKIQGSCLIRGVGPGNLHFNKSLRWFPLPTMFGYLDYRPDLEKVATLREKLWDYKLGVLWASMSLFLLQKRKKEKQKISKRGWWCDWALPYRGEFAFEEALIRPRSPTGWPGQGCGLDGCLLQIPSPMRRTTRNLVQGKSEVCTSLPTLQQWLAGESRRALSNEGTAKSHCPHSHLVTGLNSILISNNIKRQHEIVFLPKGSMNLKFQKHCEG